MVDLLTNDYDIVVRYQCSGIAVDSGSRTVFMTSWIDDESSEFLYMYDLDTGDYKGRLKMDPSPKWLQGVACFNGSLYVTSDDGNADNDEPDHNLQASNTYEI